MDGNLREILASCIREIEGGASIEGCLERYPVHADALRGHLELRQNLLASEKAVPVQTAIGRARQTMLAGLAARGARHMTPNFLTSTVARAAVFVVGALIFTGAAAGASGTLGGPDPAGDALRSVGVVNNQDNGQQGQHEGENNDCAAATPTATPEAATPNNDCHQDQCPAEAAPTPTATAAEGENQDNNCQAGDHQDKCPTTEPTPTPGENKNDCQQDRCPAEAAPTPTATAAEGEKQDNNCEAGDHHDEATGRGNGIHGTGEGSGEEHGDNHSHKADSARG